MAFAFYRSPERQTNPELSLLGMTPGFSEIAVNALKRARNGRGYTLDIDFPDGKTKELNQTDAAEIAEVVDNVTGIDAALVLQQKIAELLKD